MNKYEIAANAEIAGIAGLNKGVKLTAAQQKEIFGAYLFGKQNLYIDLDGQGEVTATASCCFGTDCNQMTWTLDEVANAVNAGKKLRCDR